MEIANIQEAESRLSGLVERALAGEVVIITKAGTPLVHLVPIVPQDTPQQGGQ